MYIYICISGGFEMKITDFYGPSAPPAAPQPVPLSGAGPGRAAATARSRRAAARPARGSGNEMRRFAGHDPENVAENLENATLLGSKVIMLGW